MAAYLLDSDAFIDYLHGMPGATALVQQLFAHGDTICTSDIVITEVYAGLRPRDEDRAEALLRSLRYLVPSLSASQQAGRWRFNYARQGIVLSAYDALIAATAIEHLATLVTANLKDYPMPELSLLPLPR